MNLSENLRIPIRSRDKSIKMDMLVQFMSRQKVNTCTYLMSSRKYCMTHAATVQHDDENYLPLFNYCRFLKIFIYNIHVQYIQYFHIHVH